MAYIYLALAFTINAAANIFLKQGASHGVQLNGSIPSLITSNWELILGMALFAINVVFYFLALRSLPLSFAYPIMVAMGFLIVNGYAFFTLGEALTITQVSGYVLIVIGLILVVARSA